MREKALPIGLAILLGISLGVNGRQALIIVQKDNDIAALQQVTKELMTQGEGLGSQVTSERQANAEKDAALSALQAQFNSVRADNTSLNKQLDDAQLALNSMTCHFGEGTFFPDYSSPAGMEQALVTFMPEISHGAPSGSSYEWVFGYKSIALYTITMLYQGKEYPSKFLVYFSEPGSNYRSGVLFLDEECWLDMPK
ncbi:MAG: hypothetical protein ABSB61_07430 [Anaerolineales bacterium]|jgi:hypothetical protein